MSETAGENGTRWPLLRVVLVCLAVLGTVLGLAATWWWALFGMSEPVGGAWLLTCCFFVFSGAVGATAPGLWTNR